MMFTTRARFQPDLPTLRLGSATDVFQAHGIIDQDLDGTTRLVPNLGHYQQDRLWARQAPGIDDVTHDLLLSAIRRERAQCC